MRQVGNPGEIRKDRESVMALGIRKGKGKQHAVTAPTVS
jgi:hypothetical protein